MAATFLDNQAVTAEDLNNIAIDLGYPDYSHFPEETPPSAVAALNQITADLVTSGVLLTGNRCAVTYADGIIYVDTGIIVFESGAKKRIESIQQLQALEGTSCVYALNDTINNTISLVCASEFPTEGDFVKLASVTDGVLGNDIRTYSSAKVELTSKPSYKIINDYFLGSYTDSDTYSPFSVTKAKEWTYEIDFDASFTHMIYELWGSKNTKFIYTMYHIDFSTSDDYLSFSARNEVYVKKSGNQLLFKCTGKYYDTGILVRNVYFF